MLNDLEKFNEMIEVINKDYSVYYDKQKGIYIPINTPMLLAKVEYFELDTQQYQTMLFERRIEDLKYKTGKALRYRTKDTKTGKEEDKDTIIEVQEKVKKVWNVSNGLGIFKSYTKKEDAIKVAKDIDYKYFDILTKD